jgi:hypothetical protein
MIRYPYPKIPILSIKIGKAMKKLSITFITPLLSLIGLLFILPLFLITLPVFLLQGIYSIVYRWRNRTRIMRWDELLQYDPEVGWKPQPNVNASYVDRCGDKCSIITDRDGWINDITMEEADIVVFGDSFAFGYGMEFQNSYIKATEKLKIKSLAAPGYNMVQEFLLMKKIAGQLHGKLVVWFVCLENDIYDNMMPYTDQLYRNPFISKNNGIKDWGIVTRHLQIGNQKYGKFKREYKRFYAKLFEQTDYSDTVFSGVNYLLKMASRLSNESGFKLVVLTIPKKFEFSARWPSPVLKYLQSSEKFNSDNIDGYFTKYCDELGLKYVSLRDHLNESDYKRYDSHWNERGNRKVASLLEDVFSEEMTASTDLNSRLP